MDKLEAELIAQFKDWYERVYGEKLSTREAKIKLREIAVVLRATKINKIKRSTRKNGK